MRSSIRVTIDARKLGHGGIGVYLDSLIRGLLSAETSRGERFFLTLLVQQDRIGKSPWSNEVHETVCPLPLYSPKEWWSLAAYVPTNSYDIFHTPHFTLPRGIDRSRAVVTIHDVIHVTHPEQWYYPIVARMWMRFAIRNAARVIAVSNATKSELLRTEIVDVRGAEKIRVIPNAIPHGYEDRVVAVPSPLNTPYLLAVISTAKPHKGLSDLIEAFCKIRNEFPSLHLVLLGEGSENLELQVDRLLVQGKVSHEEMVAWYVHAHALVIPSRVEGFSYPALEAKALGTRVISRPVGAVGEILGEDDFILPDFTNKALAEGMLQGLRTPNRSDLIENITEKFSARKVTEMLVSVYEELLNDLH